MSKKVGKSCFSIFLFTLFACICIATFFACSPKSIEIQVEGEAYRGSTLLVSAVTKGLDNPQGVVFSIKEGYDWAFFSEGKLVLTQKAQPNATLTVVAQAEGISQEYIVAVKHTPVTSVEPSIPSTVEGGNEYELSATISPSYATDVIPTYSIIEGGNIASIEGDRLIISANANKTDVLVIRTIAGDVVVDTNVAISTIQPESLEIIASSTQLRRGEVASVYCRVTPSDCTLGSAQLVVEKSDWYTYSNGQIAISQNAPEGKITIKASLGSITTTIDIDIVKTAVTKLDFYSDKNNFGISYGDRIKLFAEVFPENATYSNVKLSIVKGNEYVELDTNNYTLTVTSKEVDKEIIVKAVADGVESTLVFYLQEVGVERVLVECNGSVSVKVGDQRELRVTIIPEYATINNYDLTVIEGEEFVSLSNNVISFNAIGENITSVVVKASIGQISDTIEFSIVPIPVDSIEIASSNVKEELEGGDEITFTSTVLPANASYPELTYYIEGGDMLATVVGNKLIINEDSAGGTVYVYAKTRDGIKSNTLSFYVVGNILSKKPTNWSEVDNNPTLFDGIQRLRLNLSELPENAGCTTIIISDDVEYLELWGAYNGNRGEFNDLSIYFLTTDSIEVKLNSFGIIQSDGYTGYIIDFGTQARVKLEINGNNLIDAGDAYCIDTSGYMVDGYVGYQTSVTGEESELPTNYITKNGMDGFGGRRGGIAINAYALEIVGNGFLTVKAGSGSNGSDGTNGADHSNVAGNGGNGGYGGDSGLALLAYELVVNTNNIIKFIGGNAGIGGTAGLGGKGLTNGAKGVDGSNGIVYAPIYTYSTLIDGSKTAYTEMGKVSSNSVIKSYSTVKSFANSLESYYKVNIHYGSELDNPHSQYSMTNQSNATVLMKMMYALDYTLAVFPKNIYLELADIKEKAVDIYLADSITKKSSGGFIYGLTSTKNNVWFSTFDTKLRETFYSTYLNIFIHEFFHLLTFGMGNTSSNPLKTSLPKYNLGYSYRTSSDGVYNPEMGRSAQDSPFLTAYSKSDFNEDISDNMSLVCMQVIKKDFLASNAPVAKKVLHISEVYEGVYYNLANYTPVVWKRFL